MDLQTLEAERQVAAQKILDLEARHYEAASRDKGRFMADLVEAVRVHHAISLAIASEAEAV